MDQYKGFSSFRIKPKYEMANNSLITNPKNLYEFDATTKSPSNFTSNSFRSKTNISPISPDNKTEVIEIINEIGEIFSSKQSLHQTNSIKQKKSNKITNNSINELLRQKYDQQKKIQQIEYKAQKAQQRLDVKLLNTEKKKIKQQNSIKNIKFHIKSSKFLLEKLNIENKCLSQAFNKSTSENLDSTKELTRNESVFSNAIKTIQLDRGPVSTKSHSAKVFKLFRSKLNDNEKLYLVLGNNKELKQYSNGLKKTQRQLLNLKEDTINAVDNVKKRNLTTQERLKEVKEISCNLNSQRFQNSFEKTINDSQELPNFNTILSDIFDASNSFDNFQTSSKKDRKNMDYASRAKFYSVLLKEFESKCIHKNKNQLQLQKLKQKDLELRNKNMELIQQLEKHQSSTYFPVERKKNTIYINERSYFKV